jgi:parallel beta-helix repeat protein
MIGLYYRKVLITVVCIAALGMAGRALFGPATAAPRHTLFLPVTATGASFYVDCAAGSDANSGRDAGQAWQSLARANRASLWAGDRLLLRRGCVWAGTLAARWHGSATHPIVIGAYGSGALPQIVNGAPDNVKITGSYQLLENLEARSDPFNPDPGCANQPVGWRIGFDFLPGATNNILRQSKVSGNTAGVRLARGADHNLIRGNTIVGNIGMQILDRAPGNDLGAWGMVVNGSDNEIAYNYLAGNTALCSYDAPAEGNAIELYQAQRNAIHHNVSVQNKDFSELGGSSNVKADSNLFAYNLHISSLPGAHFLIVRGAGSSWGPTWRTQAYNNTVYLSNPSSEAVVCHAGCGPDILVLKNNILWAEKKALYADGPLVEDHNLYWNSAGAPLVQMLNARMSGTSRKADPRFAGAAGGNFQLQAGSPAIDAGTSTGLGYRSDLRQQPVPQGAGFDLGAYEFGAPSN